MMYMFMIYFISESSITCNTTSSNELGSFIWKPTDSGILAVKWMYEDLMNGRSRFTSKYLLRLKIPLKTKSLCGSFIEKFYWVKIIYKQKWNKCNKCCSWLRWNNRAFVSLVSFCKYCLGELFSLLIIFHQQVISRICSGIGTKTKARIRIGMSALCWSIWGVNLYYF
jgi:hypothetical protein